MFRRSIVRVLAVAVCMLAAGCGKNSITGPDEDQVTFEIRARSLDRGGEIPKPLVVPSPRRPLRLPAHPEPARLVAGAGKAADLTLEPQLR